MCGVFFVKKCIFVNQFKSTEPWTVFTIIISKATNIISEKLRQKQCEPGKYTH